MNKTQCMDCEAPGGDAGTVCRECGRGIIQKLEDPDTMWVINTESRSYDWFVLAKTERECRREFARMWNEWCKASGADPYYWGNVGDKWADIDCLEVQVGVGMMDREVFR